MFSKLTDKILAPHRKEDHLGTTEVPIQSTTTTTTSINNNTNTIVTPIVAPVATSTTTTTTVLPATTTTSIDATTTKLSNVSIDEAIAQGTIVRETIVKPAIVEEVVRKDTVVEVQPIVHREIEQPIIHHIDQHVVEPKAAFVGGTVTNQPIIQEHVSTRVIEEVQPIVHREIAVPKVQKVEEHVQERVVAPTQHTHDKTQITGLASDLTHQKDAIVKTAIVEETIRNDKIVEVQPVIHRDIERTIVRHIEEHVVEPAAPFVGGRVENAAIVEEHVTARAVDEIQPIVHRELAVPKVEKVEEHLQERVVAPTQHTNAVMEKAGLASSITHDKAAIVKPAIIDEKVREDIVVEVQPVVHREIDQKIVNHVEEHVVEPAAPFVGGTVQNKPIIDEKINTKVIDEVQPVLHREVAVPVIEKKEVHVAEHIVAPTQHTRDEKTIAGHVTDIHASKNAIVKPAIVDEKIRTDTVVEVQPIVHREIDQKVVNHVEEHIVEPRAANVGGKIVNAPKVEERVVTEVVQEVQPVVHREIAVPVVEKVEEHLKERVVAPTQHTNEKIEIIEKREEVKIDPASLSNFEKNKLLKKESKHTAAM